MKKETINKISNALYITFRLTTKLISVATIVLVCVIAFIFNLICACAKRKIEPIKALFFLLYLSLYPHY